MTLEDFVALPANTLLRITADINNPAKDGRRAAWHAEKSIRAGTLVRVYTEEVGRVLADGTDARSTIHTVVRGRSLSTGRFRIARSWEDGDKPRLETTTDLADGSKADRLALGQSSLLEVVHQDTFDMLWEARGHDIDHDQRIYLKWLVHEGYLSLDAVRKAADRSWEMYDDVGEEDG